MDDKEAILRAVPLFAELDDRSLQAIATLAREQSPVAGTVLMREGEPGETFLVIVEGTVRVEQAGREVRSMIAGGFLGEIALLEHGPRTATATCVSDCRLLSLGHFEFDRLLATFPEVRTKVLAAIARRSRTAGS
ncbi:MAG TPA: cyclic nucleotide-binding domain-containing protein [Candidatus Binatus sp.]|nr:cyclic nucleotide-binding domain-containing protein [Candidatus Binatus sp.]